MKKNNEGKMKIADVNRLGKELELYISIDYIGKGFPIILPRGAKIIKTIRNEVEKIEELNGFKIVRTPSLSNSEIYKIEDRYSLEKENLFIIKGKDNSNYNEINSDKTFNEIVLKPYSQPFHCTIYKLNKHSYKELPIKYCETSTIFRNERDIKGIMRTRQVTLSDASIFCDTTKVKKEIEDVIRMQAEFIKKLGIDVTYQISTWDDEKKEEYIGQIDEWQNVTNAMKDALDNLQIKYEINNDSKMYGPSISLYYEDVEFSVLQVDFEITHRFELTYTSNESKDVVPIYIHHTIIGSYENLLSILLEKYNGDFPFWIAPTQCAIISDGEEFDEYALKVEKELNKYIKAEIDRLPMNRDAKIERNKKLKVPYIVEIGKEELNSNSIKVIKEKNKRLKLDDFVKEILECQTM